MEVPDRARILKLDEPPFAGRVRYLAVADRSVIQSIKCGILFVMAFWSGSSFLSFGRLKKALAIVDPRGRLEVVIVDTDGCPNLYEAPEFVNKLHGNGEAAWVRDGRVLCTAVGNSDATAFEVFTRHLLNE